MLVAAIQQQFNFKGGTYDLKIFKNKDSVTVILSELAINIGPSITNVFEKIATQVYHQFLAEIPIDAINWIEHYNKESYTNLETYPEIFDQAALVWDPKTKSFCNPQWKPCSASGYHQLASLQ